MITPASSVLILAHTQTCNTHPKGELTCVKFVWTYNHPPNAHRLFYRLLELSMHKHTHIHANRLFTNTHTHAPLVIQKHTNTWTHTHRQKYKCAHTTHKHMYPCLRPNAHMLAQTHTYSRHTRAQTHLLQSLDFYSPLPNTQIIKTENKNLSPFHAQNSFCSPLNNPHTGIL